MAFATSFASYRCSLHGGRKYYLSQKFNAKKVLYNPHSEERMWGIILFIKFCHNIRATSCWDPLGHKCCKDQSFNHCKSWRYSGVSTGHRCSLCFAKVLDAVGNNNETSLLRRTDWPSSWRAVIKLENTTAVPGKEQTCTWFGVCHAKFVLLKSEQEIAKNFTITLPRMQLWEIHVHKWISALSQPLQEIRIETLAPCTQMSYI